MEIYVQIYSSDSNTYAWYTDDIDGQYLISGKELWCFDSPYGEYCRGTAFKNIRDAKAAGKNAKHLANWQGLLDIKVLYWKVSGNKLINIKL